MTSSMQIDKVHGSSQQQQDFFSGQTATAHTKLPLELSSYLGWTDNNNNSKNNKKSAVVIDPLPENNDDRCQRQQQLEMSWNVMFAHHPFKEMTTMNAARHRHFIGTRQRQPRYGQNHSSLYHDKSLLSISSSLTMWILSCSPEEIAACRRWILRTVAQSLQGEHLPNDPQQSQHQKSDEKDQEQDDHHHHHPTPDATKHLSYCRMAQFLVATSGQPNPYIESFAKTSPFHSTWDLIDDSNNDSNNNNNNTQSPVDWIVHGVQLAMLCCQEEEDGGEQQHQDQHQYGQPPNLTRSVAMEWILLLAKMRSSKSHFQQVASSMLRGITSSSSTRTSNTNKMISTMDQQQQQQQQQEVFVQGALLQLYLCRPSWMDLGLATMRQALMDASKRYSGQWHQWSCGSVLDDTLADTVDALRVLTQQDNNNNNNNISNNNNTNSLFFPAGVGSLVTVGPSGSTLNQAPRIIRPLADAAREHPLLILRQLRALMELLYQDATYYNGNSGSNNNNTTTASTTAAMDADPVAAAAAAATSQLTSREVRGRIQGSTVAEPLQITKVLYPTTTTATAVTRGSGSGDGIHHGGTVLHQRVTIYHWGYGYTEPVWVALWDVVILSIPSEVLLQCGVYGGVLDFVALYLHLLSTQLTLRTADKATRLKSRLVDFLIALRKENPTIWHVWLGSTYEGCEIRHLLLSCDLMSAQQALDSRRIKPANNALETTKPQLRIKERT